VFAKQKKTKESRQYYSHIHKHIYINMHTKIHTKHTYTGTCAVHQDPSLHWEGLLYFCRGAYDPGSGPVAHRLFIVDRAHLKVCVCVSVCLCVCICSSPASSRIVSIDIAHRVAFSVGAHFLRMCSLTRTCSLTRVCSRTRMCSLAHRVAFSVGAHLHRMCSLTRKCSLTRVCSRTRMSSLAHRVEFRVGAHRDEETEGIKGVQVELLQ